ncbi:xaa-Pro aminopeptidase 2 [Episyrphus balteatus]|uniref:xaa-Pro aminopeptidase 2 n=1 Tax=Episyrphus balteatus TaxID=286459 RepID=UPI002484E316|nr:xaa-Pro aminopeptidase 2 [Episyrphus balteatus]
MSEKLIQVIFFILAIFSSVQSFGDKPEGFERESCNRKGLIQPVTEYRKRLQAVREQMLIRASLQGPEIDAYILTSYDEHLNEEVAVRDQRLQYLTGFTGRNAFVVITHKGSALWTENRYLQQADGELDCNWNIYPLNETFQIADWLVFYLEPDMRVGADPHLVPHNTWLRWERELMDKFFTLVKVNNNLVDLIWGWDRPPSQNITINIQDLRFAGEKWQSKVENLRQTLKEHMCDAMVVTSLTEIAYLLNIRGRDIPYTPVVKAYLIVSQQDLILYVDRVKVHLGLLLHLKADLCHSTVCVDIKEYNAVWSDIRTFNQIWKKVLIPAPCPLDHGASQAVYTSIQQNLIYEHVSPIIFMRAQKNFEERMGMRAAHIRDGAAMCEAMSNLEQRFNTEKWTEETIKFEVERSRLSQPHSKGLSLRTVVAFGKHSALPFYISSNVTDIDVTDQSTLVIESGGQYFDGTTDVSRTFHFGQPTTEQRQAYTNVLSGILRLSHLKFPADLRPSEIDALSRSAVWDAMSDYPHATGHGIGSHLSVEEPPIAVSYTDNSTFHFREGYYFSNEPGYYRRGSFGIRLENVLEVLDTGRTHPSGSKFLAFTEVTLVPYEPKLIDRTILSAQEKRWLNEYNGKIRQLVGDELKRQGNMQAFYWMMNKTRHIREFLPEDEYRVSKGSSIQIITSLWLAISITILNEFIQRFL